MKIEEALEIINNTNFYNCFTDKKQDEAFDMAIGALLLFQTYKREVKVLQRKKGDHIAQVLANCFGNDIDILEGSDDMTREEAKMVVGE